MNNKIPLVLIAFLILPLISSAGTIQLSPNPVERFSYLNITINPSGGAMESAGVINKKSDGSSIAIFNFNCPNTLCTQPSSINYYIDSRFYSDYYVSVFDWGLRDFVKKDLKVIQNSCENRVKDGNETDVDCGGNKCSSCENNKSCLIDSDCNSGYCGIGKRCEIKNGLNVKNKEKYSSKEVIIVSDENWKEVLKLVSIADWREEQTADTFVYPALIYHKEENKFDADSIIHFLQIYNPSHVTIFGDTPKKFDKLLILNNNIPKDKIRDNPGNYLGAGLKPRQISKVSFDDYYSYWKKTDALVVSENNYSSGLMASVFASYKNAPLLFEDEIDYNVINGKNIYVIGNISRESFNKILNNANSIQAYSLEEIQKKYIELTNTNKVIAVNPKDLEISLDKSFRTEKGSRINEIYNKMSLAAPFLAAAKNEIIINIPIKESPDNSGCKENAEITNNFNLANDSIKSQINSLFDGAPEYLTIIASPNSIPDSKYRKCHETGFQMREALDRKYGKMEDNQIKTGRIYGITISDASSYVARDVFYLNIFEDIYGSDYTGLTIGHSFKKYSDNMQKQYNITTEGGYDTKCYTGEFREGCVKNKKAPLDEYSKKQFIIFGDHGKTDEWLDTLKSNEVPWLDLSYVFAHACLTNNYWQQKNKDLMGVSILRKGAISYQGAVGVSYLDNSETIALQRLLTSNFSLGELNKNLSNELSIYDRDYMLLGDPALKPIFKQISWEESELFRGEEMQKPEILTRGYITYLDTTESVYHPNEDILIKTKVLNQNPALSDWNLEYDVFAEDGTYISELVLEKIQLNANEEKESYFSMEVIDTMPSGNYIGIIRLLNGDKVLDEKEISFKVEGTLKKMEVELKACEDKRCDEESKVFGKGEKVYLDYESSVHLDSTVFLEYPNGTKKIISLPYEFSESQEGSYILKLNASKDGYEGIERNLIFGIIGESEDNNTKTDVQINLKKGWNLISVPVLLENNSIEDVFKTIINRVVLISSFDDEKLYYPKLQNFSELKEIDYKKGYWIKMNESAELNVSGFIPSNKTLTLKKGWNLIGYPCKTEENIEEVFKEITSEIDIVNGFDEGAKSYSPDLKEFSDLEMIKPNSGYWIKIKNETELKFKC